MDGFLVGTGDGCLQNRWTRTASVARALGRVNVGPRGARGSSVRRGVRFAAQPSWPRSRAVGAARTPGSPHNPRAVSTCAPMMCTFPLVLAVAYGGCRQAVAPRDGAPPPPAPPPAATTPAPSVAAQAAEVQPTRAPSAAEAPGPVEPAQVEDVKPTPPCPEGMAHVVKSHCPDLERRCVKSEYESINRLTICHKFEPGSGRCLAPRVELDFCIDLYEFPKQKGAHPPVMLSWHDAKRLCAEHGKRLCRESEWVAACEGPEEKPFPYGWERSAKHCNIDNPWISPSLEKIHSSRPNIRDPELERLDQSVPSGAREGCVSDYGVYDLTGNFDEWVRADRVRSHRPSKGSALKGGAWGHVRNACRPVTTSHDPEFRYYFVSFRCCSDPGTPQSEVSSASVSAPTDRVGVP